MKTRPDPYRNAMDTALRLLARREHTRAELTDKLRLRGLPADVTAAVLDACEHRGYVDNDRSARAYVRERQKKGYGRHRIRQGLKQKGLDDRSIESALSAETSASGERATARRAFEKKRPVFDRETDGRKRREKIYRFLYQRGFSADVIAEVMASAAQPHRDGG